jgi:CDGSH-type Zn-finger protein
MAQVKITARPNGPFRVEAPEGSVELVDADGNKFDISGKPAFSLCRCGGSINKPFCDGTRGCRSRREEGRCADHARSGRAAEVAAGVGRLRRR